jgi:hypothetical protein
MPSGLPPTRGERSRLLRAYLDAATSYVTRVREMADFVTSGDDEVGASEARRMSRTALEAFPLGFVRHEADHSCDRPADLHKVPETPPESQIEPLPLDPTLPRPTVILNCLRSRFS